MGFFDNLAIKTAALQIIQDADSYLSIVSSKSHITYHKFSPNQTSSTFDIGAILAEKYGLPNKDDLLKDKKPIEQLFIIFYTVFWRMSPYLAAKSDSPSKFMEKIVKYVYEKRVYTFLYDFVHRDEAIYSVSEPKVQKTKLNRPMPNPPNFLGDMPYFRWLLIGLLLPFGFMLVTWVVLVLIKGGLVLIMVLLELLKDLIQFFGLYNF